MEFKLIERKIERFNQYNDIPIPLSHKLSQSEIASDTTRKLSNNVRQFSKGANSSLGIEKSPLDAISDVGEWTADRLGNEEAIENQINDKNTKELYGNNILKSYTQKMYENGSYSETSLSIVDEETIKDFPEIFYVLSLLPHINEDEEVLPIADIHEGYQEYFISLSESSKNSSLYNNVILPGFMLGNYINPPKPLSKIGEKIVNNLNSSKSQVGGNVLGGGLRLTQFYLIPKMRETLGDDNITNINPIELQETIYQMTHNYLKNNYNKVKYGLEISNYEAFLEIILKDIFKININT